MLLYGAFIGSILIYFWGIWAIPTLSHNEARRMIVVQEMLTHHNWLIPTINNEIYIEKPPLFYWLALPFVLIFRSTAEWVIRLPSALSAFALTWLLFFRIRRYFDRWSALLSALVLITSFYFSETARLAELPMILTTCCCCALLFYFDYLQDNKKKICTCHIFLWVWLS
jgi:4-amino-4-deoxy-L-arabinose transferase-like glycosyltransferase